MGPAPAGGGPISRSRLGDRRERKKDPLKKTVKKLFTSLSALALLLALTLTAAASGGGRVSIQVDGAPLNAPGAYISQAGTTMVPLRAVAEALGFTVTWNAATRTVGIWSEGSAPAETPDSGGTVDAVVVLDPGHGGSATGASYGGVQEKDLNLAIAKKVVPLLEAAGVQVTMTRTTDKTVGLYQRTDLANGLGADLFVSIHCNASTTNPQATGIYTAAYSAAAPGWRLAQTLRRSMMAATGAGDMGTEARPELAVLRTSKMPAALVECGFMSTPAELEKLRSAAYQTKVAQGIADGILSYLRG